MVGSFGGSIVFRTCQAKDARAKLADLCAVKRVKSADCLLEVTKAAGSLLVNMDEWWALEAGLLKSLCGATAETRACISILAELPSEDKHVDLKVSLARLEALSQSEAMKLSPTGIHAALRYINKALAQLVQGVCLAETLDACTPIVRKALNRFQFFLKFVDHEDTTLLGESAYKAVWQHLERVVGEKKEVKQELFDKLQTYQWLAPGESATQVAELIKTIREGDQASKKKLKVTVASSTSASASSSSTSACASSSTSAKPLSKDKAKTIVMRYFNS